MSTYQEITARAWNECRLFDAVFELTHKCNLDCFFCYNDRIQLNSALTFDEYSKLLEQLAEMAVLNLTLTGGEPLVHPEFFAIGARARELGFVVRLKSNGHILRGDVARRVRDEVAPYQIDLSIHGATADTHDRQTRRPGSFKRLLENIEEMNGLGLRMKLNCTLTAWNEGDIEQVLELADHLGLPINITATVSPKDDGDTTPMSVAPSSKGLSRLSEILSRRHEEARRRDGAGDTSSSVESKTPEVTRHCGAGSSSVTIDQWGNVLPCVQWRRVVGNVREKPIAEIWSESARLDEVRSVTVAAKGVAPKMEGPGDVTLFCPGIADLLTGDPLALYPGLPAPDDTSSDDDTTDNG